MNIVVFEDEHLAWLDPVTLGKPAFAISCGGYRLIDLLERLGEPLSVIVRPHLREIVKADFPHLAVTDAPLRSPSLLVNARLVPEANLVDRLQQLIGQGRAATIRSAQAARAEGLSGDEPRPLAAAMWTPTTSQPELTLTATNLAKLDQQTLADATHGELPLFAYPHDILRHHQRIFSANLTHRLDRGEYREVASGVFSAAELRLSPYCVTDATRGPIVIESGASIGPYCYLSGPLYLGSSARVLEHAALKDGVMVGHTAKIGGEVEASIIEPYTNKQHHGFLGHSYLGSWINLGAGTCNSDLKNTYGQVNMEYQGRKVATEMQFVGAIIGDYAKTAINTGIFTGKTIGACSMVYGFVTTNVPSFVNYARLFGQVSEAPVEVMIATQKRMFARRSVEQRACDVQLLHDMHQLTARERQASGKPLSLEPLNL